MHQIIGCDEAGYGPNLGPLLISATQWQLPDAADANTDLYTLLSDCVCSRPDRSTVDANRRLTIADSKQLFTSGGSYEALELAVLVGLWAIGRQATSFRGLLKSLAPTCQAVFDREPWHAGYDQALPVDADPATLDALVARFADAQNTTGAKLLDLRSDCVFPARFNQLCRQHGSKGLVLSTCTLRLVADMINASAAERITVLADKHGGRNRYGELIQAALEDRWVEVRRESREESAYRVRDGRRTIDFYFRVGGEASLPTAWASLCCKYLRELCMDAFNAYWADRVPGLTRTAGYPVDAKRFMADIAEALASEGIERDVIWRTK